MRLHQSRRALAWLLNAMPSDPAEQLLPPPAAAKALLPEPRQPPAASISSLARLFLREYGRRQDDWPDATAQILPVKDWALAQPQEQPLPARTWRRARRRSERWHRDLNAQQLQTKRRQLLDQQNGQIRNWPNAIDQWECPELPGQFSALRDEYDLLNESGELKHCVGSRHYGNACFQNQSRIFHVSSPYGPFTLELRREFGSQWEVRQLQGARNSQAPGAVWQAAARFAGVYSQAAARRSSKAQQGWWSPPPPEPEANR